MSEGAAGFWSYVHDDDAADDGLIRALADRVRAQFKLLTAEELNLFVDHDVLEWGTEWSLRIDDAIAGATFFIPIVTPSYFKSAACRNELRSFASEATRLGLRDLLMPIYWVTVPALEGDAEQASDELIALVSRFQRQDLRYVRLEEVGSGAFRTAASSLAAELATRIAAIADVSDVPSEPAAQASAPIHLATPSNPADPHDPDSPGLLEQMAESEAAVPELEGILDQLSTAVTRVGELLTLATEEMERSDQHGEGMKGRLRVTQRLAKSLEEPAELIEQAGRNFAAALVQADPGILTMIELVGDPDQDESPEDRETFLRSILEVRESAAPGLKELRVFLAGLSDIAKFSRALRPPVARMKTGLQGVLDGEAVLEGWAQKADAARRGAEGTRGP
jgi:hypothetical protein